MNRSDIQYNPISTSSPRRNVGTSLMQGSRVPRLPDRVSCCLRETALHSDSNRAVAVNAQGPVAARKCVIAKFVHHLTTALPRALIANVVQRDGAEVFKPCTIFAGGDVRLKSGRRWAFEPVLSYVRDAFEQRDSSYGIGGSREAMCRFAMHLAVLFGTGPQ